MLRNNMDAAEYKHIVLGLIFLKYISDAFEAKHAELSTPAAQAEGSNPEDPDEYKASSIFWVPRAAIGPEFDPYDAGHRAVLFDWLNDWGCRQFAKEHHATTASVSLETWARTWLTRLPGLGVDLTDLSDADIEMCVRAYDALRGYPASLKRLASGRTTEVTYGPTGAAKTLFALRRNVFAPWDDPIRDARGWGSDAASFRAYLRETASQLRTLSAEAGVPVGYLPALVGRPKSSPPKLIDEYNWVTLTKRCPPPKADEVTKWATWADRETPPSIGGTR
jgi:hypothetical protein